MGFIINCPKRSFFNKGFEGGYRIRLDPMVRITINQKNKQETSTLFQISWKKNEPTKSPSNGTPCILLKAMDTSSQKIHDLFPHIPKDQIFTMLKKFDNDSEKTIDYLLTNSFDPVLEDGIEDKEAFTPSALLNEQSLSANESNSSEADKDWPINFQASEIMEIMAMFPLTKKHVIESAYIDNDYNLERTINYLIENPDGFPDVSASSTDIKKSYKGTDSLKVEKISELTGLTQFDAEVVFQKNKKDVIDALVDIMKSPQYKHSSKPTGLNENPNIPQGGRVQKDGNRSKASDISSKEEETSYIFDENSKEVQDFCALVFDDKSLVQVSWVFYTDCLKFFKGDTSKVLSLAFHIIENKGIEKTYREGQIDYSRIIEAPTLNKKQYKTQFESVSSSSLASIRTSQTSNLPINDSGLDEDQVALQKQQLAIAKRENKLDLHNFNVQNAKITTSKALEEWWNDELKARETIGKAQPGQFARVVEPFIIITGKGIHSYAGIPKLKLSINSWLKRSNYIHEEMTGFLCVKGKRSK